VSILVLLLLRVGKFLLNIKFTIDGVGYEVSEVILELLESRALDLKAKLMIIEVIVPRGFRLVF